jgi:hypothetical protein
MVRNPSKGSRRNHLLLVMNVDLLWIGEVISAPIPVAGCFRVGAICITKILTIPNKGGSDVEFHS